MLVKVALFPSEEGFAVCAPSLPGWWSQGATREEALADIEIAIQEYLDADMNVGADAEIREIEVAV